ncbi:helix-turn-helix family protein [Burkholderia ambifaria AMMD]|uniref:Transcriptional regulator, XRE family with cupin sensor n=1 Tax=Burkholderia ambifaria (strain ATCC BAA-244 / DSM 16087 / CCUG 44356 / LMG 19182 / AMMD) TaxID=339670 RepID=Q0B5Q3_BURCM|nr:XRE family transcriptional regulator [Burkholderia ambifaria]ABI90520.1 transcriptional regulator, XRE family with cupin sensor [Burkholderia ambifaria AMMD]AJY25085.1 helix-turn-helix family protein [Burkholderia ambifaria AMMD]MBR7931704.1 helix-turn-helix transcriptional regulator [Burkholderia ambifaria]PEH68563.1 XRE family transcriptional regulator [Burkholderia ambifaria]QQC06863.1 helix-turn-helix transcriptional regulator [Burkholderia ambifaria]
MASSSASRRTPAAAAPQPSGVTPPRVGEQIQRLRNERKLTLDDLSRAAGVSKSMLSEIERDKANPTIAVAWRLTNALGITLDELFSQPKAAETIRVDGPHDIPTLAGHDGRYQLRVWGPIDLAGKFEWYELTLPGGGALVSNAHEPGTREHLTVLHGAMEIDAAAASRRLKAGDTARYAADTPHAIRNPGKAEARALLIVIHR